MKLGVTLPRGEVLEAGPDELGAALRERYDGLADQVVPTPAGEHHWHPDLFRAVAKTL